MALTLDVIQQSVAGSDYEVSLHADQERLADGLTIGEIEEVLKSAELLEDYPDDSRGQSCLVLGFTQGRPVHCVCGLSKQSKLIIITVYRPSLPKWRDERTRNP